MRKQIFIVDDKETIAKIVTFYLSKDYDTMHFENPIRVMTYLKDNPAPDLFILDIRMPEMRGDDFLLYLKGNDLYKHIPVIMLSSEDSTSERIRLLQEGADDYVVKPFNPMEIMVRVAKIIG